ncbi:MAG: trypsin-like peptidase domain-containing protein [Spirochaetia bacterium]|jgi:S1-C subfamily serine protease
MKLYTRRHVAILSIVLALVAVGAGVLATALIIVPHAVQRELAALPVQSEPAVPLTPVQYNSTMPSLGAGGLIDDELNNIQIYDKANKAVVYVTTVTTGYTWYYQQVQQKGTGSGVIIDQQGHVLTNNHVISGADRISITLSDGTITDGKVVGTDPENDLAVVQFNPKGKTLTTIPFGDSASLKVGMKVLAIGNPFGLDRTLTTGIVSGLARPLQTDTGYMIRETIQTDAAINPGNSGGPLLNSHGELIGINTAIESPSGASAGVGFAIPVNTVKPIADDLIHYGMVKRGTIDIQGIDLFPQLVDYFNLPVQKGVLVNVAGSMAQQAGIRGGDKSQAVRSRGGQVIYGGGDIIVEINGQKIEAMTDLYSALADTKPGEIATVKIMRGTQIKTVTVKLIEATPQSQ